MIQHDPLLNTLKAQCQPAPENPRLGSFVFNAENLRHYKKSLTLGLDRVRSAIESADRPFTGILPHELAKEFQSIDLDHSFQSLDDALNEISDLYLQDAVYFHHPRYVAHLNCPVVIPAILGDLISTSINTAVETWDQSAGATFMEQKLIDWTVGKIGLGPRADGVFTSGGSQSNLMALLLARDHFLASNHNHNTKQRGLPAEAHKLRIFTSEMSHFSVQKSAAILGLGYDAVVTIAIDRYFRMDVTALESEMKRCREEGLLPMAVVATAGTTDFGSIDPLPEISELCRRDGIWMHVDAAYGCGLLVSPKHRHWLRGIEQADSVTVDYHKSFFQPVSCSAFLVREKKHLAYVTHHAEYLNPLEHHQEGTPNLVNKSLQTTRRFDALKLWLTLRTVGAENLGRAFDQVLHLARQTYLLFLSEPTLKVLHRPQMSTLVFRYLPEGGHSAATVDAVNAHIRKALSRSGETLVAGTKVGGRQYLKFTLLNPTTTIRDILAILKLIKQHGQDYMEQQHNRQTAPAFFDADPASVSPTNNMEYQNA